jgi:hypothetical protein
MRHLVYCCTIFILVLTACQKDQKSLSPSLILTPTTQQITDTVVMPGSTSSPILDPTARATLEPTSTPTPAPPSYVGRSYGMAPYVPMALQGGLFFPPQMKNAENFAVADIRLVAESSKDPSEDCLARYSWVYALVAPFPTVDDAVEVEEVQTVWKGGESETFPRRPLMMDPETAAVFTTVWGEPAATAVQIIPVDELLNSAWVAQRAWGIVSFEQLEARWKVLKVGENSPFNKDMTLSDYPLAVTYCWVGNAEVFQAWQEWSLSIEAGRGQNLTLTNRDTNKMSVLNMTGTTALVRGTAATMEEKGITYPAKDIGPFLREADLTHISNEVSFTVDCPPGLPLRPGASFCARPEYYALIEETGADIIELTGNHINDWGPEALTYTLGLYHQNGLLVFGGGANLEEARNPLLVEDHGNRLAFIGCNTAGPERAWATQDSPGAAPCDRDWLASEIAKLRDEGYLPIVTFQHLEVCDMLAHMTQMADFSSAARAGAVIVSGSQAHCPQIYAFEGQTLIHYGLGNLFFDQMDFSTRRGFIDRHVFYDGRYLGVEVVTTMIEEAARPRFMETVERRQLLREIFEAGGWW